MACKNPNHSTGCYCNLPIATLRPDGLRELRGVYAQMLGRAMRPGSELAMEAECNRMMHL